MNKAVGVIAVLTILLLIVSSSSARPVKSQSLQRQKRQSDQRLAELETLLALQKYGRHRFRTDRKKGVGADEKHMPGYGIIDFHILGRKKKSTQFSPGKLANVLTQVRESPRTNDQLDDLPWPSSEEEASYSDPLPEQDSRWLKDLYIEKK